MTSAEKGLLNDLSAEAASTQRAYLPGHYKWLENWAVRTA